jgi:glycosyltransferase involved in cell wall biosynthesis
MKKTNNSIPHTVCMIAYANYFTDARIKNYVDALLKNGYQVDVFALGQPEPAQEGLRVFCLMPKVSSKKLLPYIFSQLWFLMLVFLQVSANFVQRKYTIVHVHNMPDFIVLGALIPKLFGAKVILDVHDTMPESYATKFCLPLDHIFIRLIKIEERLSAAFSNHVITTNDLHKDALVGHGLPANKISIVMNLGNPAIFHPHPKFKSTGGLTLAYHGTVAERLGLDLILKAIQYAQPHCLELSFILLGDGEFMPEVKRLIIEYRLENIVQVKGWVPVNDLPAGLATANVGVIGNRQYTETYQNWMLPVKMLEYAAMEIPTIAPRLKVIQHYFDENSAFYYTPDDAEDLSRRIIELYQQPEKILKAKESLRMFNQRYCWSALEKEYLDLVKELIYA